MKLIPVSTGSSFVYIITSKVCLHHYTMNEWRIFLSTVYYHNEGKSLSTSSQRESTAAPIFTSLEGHSFCSLATLEIPPSQITWLREKVCLPTHRPASVFFVFVQNYKIRMWKIMNGLSALLATRWQFCLHNWQNGDNFVCIIGNNIAVSSAFVTVTVLSALLALMWTFSLHYWQQGDSFVFNIGNLVTFVCIFSNKMAVLVAILTRTWQFCLHYWQ